MIMYKITF